jgi:hypothetical protein
MRLASIKAYRSSFFAPDSAPTIATIRAQAKDGTLPGVLQGGRWYIDLDELDRRMGVTAKLDQQQKALLASPDLEGLV